MAILNIFIFISLVRANQYFSEFVAATLWTIVAFTSGLISLRPLLPNLLRTAASFIIALMVFKFLKRRNEYSAPWLATFVVGAGALIFLL